MLDVRRLRLLSELSRHGTIAAVAHAVGYTPSAVSQALSVLEREAGVALLERDGRRVRLTHAAHALVARADRILAELDAAEADLAVEQGSVRGAVTIGTFPSAGASLVASAVRQLEPRYPGLSCAVREHEPEDGIGLLRSGELDLLVSESYDGVPSAPVGGLEQYLLVSEPLLLAVPAGLRADGLRDASWIGGLAGTQYATAVERACSKAGFEPKIVHRADDQSLLQGLVAAGLGVALLPELACTPAPGVDYLAFDHAPRRRVTALARRAGARRPALTAVIDALTAAARDRADGAQKAA